MGLFGYSLRNPRIELEDILQVISTTLPKFELSCEGALVKLNK